MTLKEALILSYVKRGIGHGYSILHHVRNNRSDEWVDFSRAGLYKTLDKLEKEQLITCTVKRKGNRPPRKIYTITPDGEQVLGRYLEEGFSFTFRTKCDLDTYLVAAVAASPETGFILDKVRRRIEAVEQHIAELETEWPAEKEHYPFIVYVLYKRRLESLRHEHDWLTWLTTILATVKGDIMQMTWGESQL